MSTLIIREIKTPDGRPVSFPDGITTGPNTASGTINNIGLAGQQGFGVGIAPLLPAGFAKLSGTDDPASPNYGNYQYSDGSVMVYVPAFFYKYGTGANGLGVNAIDVKAFGAYADVASANAAGYALHRAFYNAGAIRQGFFVDKYLCSNNGGTSSSLRLGNPLSSDPAHNPFGGLTGAPANAYYGAIAAAKTRGAIFFCNTRFIHAALALLATAHGAAAVSATYCAWYDAGGVTNFPKGANNNALGDTNDGAIAYVSDGYSNSVKTGSANFLQRTTHNGQLSGVADLNGAMWEINLGITSDGANFYLFKTTADAAAVTGSNAGATDAWGATGLAALYDNIGATYGALTASSTQKTFGNVAQVMSEATGGTAWTVTGAGIPLVGGVGGTNKFGNDGLWDYRPNELCAISGAAWTDGALAGVWALYLHNVRGNSADGVGFRAASYL